MKPIRVMVRATGDEGTWIDTVTGPTEAFAIIVLDDGTVISLYLGSIKVMWPNTVKLRVTA